MEISEQTIAIDFDSGLRLASYPGLLTQAKVDGDFYVGQARYVVKEILPVDQATRTLYIYVQRAPSP